MDAVKQFSGSANVVPNRENGAWNALNTLRYLACNLGSVFAFNGDDAMRYRGTRAELVAAGLLRDGDFPGDEQSGRKANHTFTREGRHFHIRYSSRLEPPTFWLFCRPVRERGCSPHAEQPADKISHRYEATRTVDGDWPPDCEGNSDIAFDGGEIVGTAKALVAAKVLLPQDVPGNPECPRQWARWGRYNGTRFGAVRVGQKIVVALYDN